MEQQNAKFSFFYLLSLVSLVFSALGTGMILFQFINKKIIDLVSVYPGGFDSGTLKFGISAVIIAAPIYFLMMWLINKSLLSGNLNKDSVVRKWLTYFILFVSSVVMIGWLIAVIYNFLDGELTARFILKALVAVSIAISIFGFYLYDIKRNDVKNKKNSIIKYSYYSSMSVVLAVLVAGFFLVDSPQLARDKKEDMATLDRFSKIEGAINLYFNEKQKLPEELKDLIGGISLVSEQDLINPVTKEKITYQINNSQFYELCATFKTSNRIDDSDTNYYDSKWKHDAGYKCLGQKVDDFSKVVPMIVK
jgi:hypothetical protein